MKYVKPKTHAYLIMAHNEPKTLQVLLNLLDDPRNHIYIHVDQSSSLNREEIASWCLKAPITMIPSQRAHWSGFSLVAITLSLLNESLKNKHHYYHLLSGVDLPLKSQDELHSFFANRDEEFVSTGLVTTWKISSRYRYFYPEKLTKYISRDSYRVLRQIMAYLQRMVFINRSKNSGLEYHMGGQWFSITHNFAQYVADKSPYIKKQFNYGFCVDEVFLPTLLMNSPFKSKVSPMMNIRYVDWSRGKPYVWQENDFEELTSQNLFFARKFSFEKHPQIVTKIKFHILNSKGGEKK